MSGKQRHSQVLQDAVKEVLLREWDPIGIGGKMPRRMNTTPMSPRFAHSLRKGSRLRT